MKIGKKSSDKYEVAVVEPRMHVDGEAAVRQQSSMTQSFEHRWGAKVVVDEFESVGCTYAADSVVLNDWR